MAIFAGIRILIVYSSGGVHRFDLIMHVAFSHLTGGVSCGNVPRYSAVSAWGPVGASTTHSLCLTVSCCHRVGVCVGCSITPDRGRCAALFHFQGSHTPPQALHQSAVQGALLPLLCSLFVMSSDCDKYVVLCAVLLGALQYS